MLPKRDSGIQRPTTGGVTQEQFTKTPVFMPGSKQMI